MRPMPLQKLRPGHVCQTEHSSGQVGLVICCSCWTLLNGRPICDTDDKSRQRAGCYPGSPGPQNQRGQQSYFQGFSHNKSPCLWVLPYRISLFPLNSYFQMWSLKPLKYRFSPNQHVALDEPPTSSTFKFIYFYLWYWVGVNLTPSFDVWHRVHGPGIVAWPLWGWEPKETFSALGCFL